MKILAIEKEKQGVSPGQFEPHLRHEAEKAWELHQSDVIREIYFRADRHEAVLVLECRDVTEAEGVLSSLPLVQEGLIEFELIPLRPYPGFSRLFE